MGPYQGRIIDSLRDEEGVVDIVEERTTLTMHFGTGARQTTMFRSDPSALALAYTRCMLCGLLFAPAPRSTLLLGLGGGSLAKFLLARFPDCRVDAVEKRPLVVDVARRYFHLPEEGRLRVFVESAGAFLRRGEGGPYDWVLVDIHASDGMDREVEDAAFFSRSQRLLAESGLASINLWSGAREQVLGQVGSHLKRAFAEQVLQLPVARKRNTVALAFNGSLPLPDTRRLRHRSALLEQHLGVEFGEFLLDLLRHNPNWR